MKILIAEDDPSVLKLIEFVLDEFELLPVASVQSLKTVDFSTIDLILLDDELSDGSALTWLQESSVSPEVWIISARKPEEALGEAYRWLQKPFDPEVLKTEVAHFSESNFAWARLVREYRVHLLREREKLKEYLKASQEEDAALRVVHSIAGSAGGYGFHELSVSAMKAEEDLRALEGVASKEVYWKRIDQFLNESSWLPALTTG